MARVSFNAPAYAQALQARRRERGLTQVQLSELTHRLHKPGGMSQRVISHLEAGKIHPLDLSAVRWLTYLLALEWSQKEFSSMTGVVLPGNG